MSRVIDPPTERPDAGWFAQAHRILFAQQDSGTTANRPTKQLYIGRPYFDTTLGYPIWVKSLNPAVWVNGAGTVV